MSERVCNVPTSLPSSPRLALCLGHLWEGYEDARWRGVRDTAHEKLYKLLWDEVPEVREWPVPMATSIVQFLVVSSATHLLWLEGCTGCLCRLGCSLCPPLFLSRPLSPSLLPFVPSTVPPPPSPMTG